jgi:hypothetical protein
MRRPKGRLWRAGTTLCLSGVGLCLLGPILASASSLALAGGVVVLALALLILGSAVCWTDLIRRRDWAALEGIEFHLGS